MRFLASGLVGPLCRPWRRLYIRWPPESLDKVDGIVSYMDSRNNPVRLAAALGLPRIEFTGQTFGGGGNGAASAVMLADAAICAGYARTVVVFRALAQGQFGRFGQAGFGYAPGRGTVPGSQSFTVPYGLITAAQINAVQTVRFMHEHGVTQVLRRPPERTF